MNSGSYPLPYPANAQLQQRPQPLHQPLHRGSLTSFHEEMAPQPQMMPVPFGGQAPVQSGMQYPRQRADMPSSRPASFVTKPIAHHASAGTPLNNPTSFSLKRDPSAMSRSSSVSSSLSTTMEMALASQLTLQDRSAAVPQKVGGFAPPSFRNGRRVSSAIPATRSHYIGAAADNGASMNAFVIPPRNGIWTGQQQAQQQQHASAGFSLNQNTHNVQGPPPPLNVASIQGGINMMQIGSPSAVHTPRRRVTLAVADLPNYGKAERRRSSAVSIAKKRKRSANISELTFSRLHKPNQPPYNLIRIWVNERNMQFYDCACGRRKAVQDLQKIVRHVEKCYHKNGVGGGGGGASDAAVADAKDVIDSSASASNDLVKQLETS